MQQWAIGANSCRWGEGEEEESLSVFYMSFKFCFVRKMVCCPAHNYYSSSKHGFMMDSMHAVREIHTFIIVLTLHILRLYDLFHMLLSL